MLIIVIWDRFLSYILKIFKIRMITKMPKDILNKLTIGKTLIKFY